MPTKPQSVPWPDVADLAGDLFEWIVGELKLEPDAARTQSPVEIAKGVLLAEADRESLLAMVARSIIDLEKYRAADHRDEVAARRQDLSEPELKLLYSDKIEREADNAIRGLAERLAHIRRLVRKVGERQHQRIEFVARTRKPERLPT